MQGLIINSQKNLYTVRYNDNEILCSVTGKIFKEKNDKKSLVVVGDIVDFDLTESDKGIIKEIMPRKSKFSRRGVGTDSRQEQILASNIDQIIIVCSVKDPKYKLNGIDRYIVAAQSGNVEPIICFNKVDNIDIKEIETDIENYKKMNIRTLCTSAFSGLGIEELKGILKDKISLFAGSSGVGKSSLTNALFNDEITKTSHTGLKHGKGRHTTTSTYLYNLPFGGMILDSPGMREFGIFDSDNSLDDVFNDISELAQDCKFNNCTHVHEPKCAVKNALDNGSLSVQRYKSYTKLKK